MKDERIRSAVKESAATGYFVVYWLMSIALGYRVLILKQNIRDFWDIFAVFSVGTIFVFVAMAGKGALGDRLRKMWLPITICALISISVVAFVMGQIHSVGDAGKTLAGAVLGMAVCIAVAYALNRWWERKAGVGSGE